MKSVSDLVRERCAKIPSFGLSLSVPLLNRIGVSGVAIGSDHIQRIPALSGREWIRYLWIQGWNVVDVSFLEGMTRLCGLYLSTPKAVFTGIGKLELLEVLGVEHKDTACVYDGAVGLKNLFLGSYDGIDCTRLTKLNLEKCELSSLVLSSLGGLKTGNLRHLTLKGCSKIQDISTLSGAKLLERLDLTGCKSIKSLQTLSSISTIKELWLIDCGVIESLDFIAGHERLETLHLYGDTKVADGRIAFLHGLSMLKKVTFANQAHYDAKSQDFPS